MDDLFKKIKNREYTHESYRTEKGSFYICKINDDEYLHVIFCGINNDERYELKRKLVLLNKNGNMLDNYLDYLQSFNGAILFGGSINLFGINDRRDYIDSPSSLLRPLLNDRISKEIYKELYIGNCPHGSGGNMNFYYNLDNGLVVGYYNNSIAITWAGIDEMIKDLIDKYDKLYLPSGLNKYYGMPEKGVYNNIQKYIF